MSPTELTLRKLRKEGWSAEVVERWIPRVNVRKDLFGFIDIVAIKDGETLGVQATSYSNMSARIHKIEDSPHLKTLREAGWSLWVIGWHKEGRYWTERVVDVS